MKKWLWLQVMIMVCLSVTGCSQISSLCGFSYFNNLESGLEGNTFYITGKGHIGKNKSKDIFQVSSQKENEIGVSGRLEHISGDVKLIYVNPDKKDIIIADSKNAYKNTLRIDTKIHIKEGKGTFQFVGNDASFDCALHFSNINPEEYGYLVGEEGLNDASED